MRERWRRWTVVGVVLVGTVWAGLVCGPGSREDSGEIQGLPVRGESKRLTLEGGATAVYRVALPVNRYLEVAVDQQGADVLIEVYDPEGLRVLEVDSPNGTDGRENISLLSETSGDYLFELRSLNPPGRSGSFTLSRQVDRDASEKDRARFAVERAFAAAEELFRRGTAADLTTARERFGSLLTQWQNLGLAAREANTQMRRGDTERALGLHSESLTDYRAALKLAESLGDTQLQVSLFLRLGIVHFKIGEAELADGFFQRSLAGARQISSPADEAATLHNLALAATSNGRFRHAVELYRQALGIFDRLQLTADQARAWSNLGEVYSRLGETRPAALAFERALERFRWLGDRRGEGIALNNLGLLHARGGELATAEQIFSEALQLMRQVGDTASEARTENNLGWIAGLRGALDEATFHYQRALGIAQRLGNPRTEANLLLNLGWLAGARKNLEESLRLHRDALARFQALGDPVQQAQALYGIAMAEHQAAREVLAQAACEAAIEQVETVRQYMAGDTLGMAFFATRQDLYDFYIDLLMTRHQLDGGTTYSRAAFAASERSRARGFLDLLATAEQAWSAASPVGLEAIRQQILDDETALLHYHLGSPHSYVWVMTRSSFEVRILPRSAALEAVARPALQLLENSHQRRYREEAQTRLRQLASAVLWPALEGVKANRLLIVADGALARLPFAALPIRGEWPGDRPLLAAYEVVHLHSASTLLALRRARAGRPPAKARLAVLADPVYAPSDPRLPAPLATTTPPSGSEFPRLVAASAEAAAISAWIPADQRLVATGAEASRQLVLSGRLADFRVLHFAVHSVLDSQSPDRSSLVLSRWDAEGRPVDGFLRLRDLRNLNLRADTVVLSGCRTALGRIWDGEGIVGLPQAFLLAGARQVIVSLFRVRDRATAELMGRFYQRHFGAGMPAAAALRHAQLSMAGDPRWQAPADWAGFVLEGDFSLSP